MLLNTNKGDMIMSYGDFKQATECYARAFGLSVKRFNDKENGKFIARFSDESWMFARPGSESVTVRWGSGHQAMFPISRVFA